MINKFVWLNHKEPQKIIKALTINNIPTFQFVGGCVRDSLLNIQTQDFDIASTLSPEENIILLKNNNINYRCNAIKYGTITAIINNSTFEITTLRKDVVTFGRKAITSAIDSYIEDAQRRDFTINAIYLNPITLKLTDYFNGIKDLANGKIRFIGNTEERIIEDYLRILRFIRFYTYFGKSNISNAELTTIKKHVNKLNILSKERIALELNKIINHRNYNKGIKLLNKLDIPKVLFYQKKLNINKINQFNDFTKKYQVLSPKVMKWFLVLNDPSIYIKYLKTQKTDTYYIKLHQKIYSELKLQKNAGYFLARYDSNLIKDSIIILLLKTKKNSKFYNYLYILLEIIKQKNDFKFCITGEDLIKLHIPKNKNFGKLLLELKEWGAENNIKCKKLYIKKLKNLIS